METSTAQTTQSNYTKDLHLKHVEAFWEGRLEFNHARNISGDSIWAKSSNPPGPNSDPQRYRIATPKQLRPWKPEEFPLGAWVRLKDSKSASIIIARAKNCAVWFNEDGEKFYKTEPSALLELFEHSTDQGKTWLPCGVEE